MTIAQLIADAGIEVKPLEWTEGRFPRFERSTCGAYEVYYTGSMAQTVLTFGVAGVQIGRFDGDVLGEKARSAAQADYTARILSALQVKP